LASEPEHLVAETLTISELVDALALFMMESFQRTREELINRQRTEITETSTPVMRMWQGIVALPLTGALDVDHTQAAMEHLLDSIVQYEAAFAIIDFSEVPVIEDRVFQQMLKTVAAIRLMGADCNHQRDPAAYRPDHGASGRRTERRVQALAGGRVRAGAAPDGPDGGQPDAFGIGGLAANSERPDYSPNSAFALPPAMAARSASVNEATDAM
jgi:hypothetical protein